MRSLKLFVVALLFVFLAFHQVQASPQNAGSHQKAQYKDGELLVKFKPGVPGAEKSNAIARAGDSLIREFPSLGIYHVALARGQGVEEAISLYAHNPNVSYAEPNYIVSVDMFPNDPDFNQLWGLNNTGQTGGTPDADIDAPEAWDLSYGIYNSVVAVIDTGIDYTHEDLVSNIWVNGAEYYGTPGVDDDTNGYVDDIYGIDTINGDSDPMDDHSHGTHVAGTIGATGSNGTGVAGVNWNINIMGCKFLGSDGYGDTAGAIECLAYIADMKNRGANIIATNNSWTSDAFSQALQDAIDAQREVLFIVAAGNNFTDNDDIPRYPASYYLPNVVAVTATNSSDGQVFNYGRHSVYLGAPGYGIYSTLPGNSYGSYSGTSMATPHVTGVAGLIKAQNQSRDWREIKNLLLSGGDSVASMDATTITGKRLNAYGALSCVDSPVFSVMKFPLYPQTGIPETLSALSINCQWAVGPVTVTVDGSQVVDLYDDGVSPDMAAGDGIFTGTWVPQSSAPQVLDFSSPAGTDSVEVNPVTITGTTVASPAIEVDSAASSCELGAYYSQTFSTSGGIPPFQWSIQSGALPLGLVLDTVTGEISGTPSTPGSFGLVIQVADSGNVTATMDYTIVVQEDIRSGYPLELQKRVGSGGLPKSFSPIFADLDNDGSQEIVVADKETLYVFGSVGLIDKVVLPGTVSTPAAADLDGDGDLEIIVGVNYPSSNPPIYAFHHDLTSVAGFPAGAFPTYSGSPGYLSAPVIADLDGNGSKEIIIVASPNNIHDTNYEKAVFVVVDSSGSTITGWPLVIDDLLTMGYPRGLAVEDLNGDGTNEIVYVSRYNTLYVLSPDGTVTTQWTVAPDFLAAHEVSIADLDADGSQNIIVRYNTSTESKVVVFDTAGNIMPGWPQSFPNDVTGNGFAVADLDGNFTLELVVPINNNIYALRYDGSSLPGWPISTGGWPNIDCYPVVGDINGDGQPEILINTAGWGDNSGAVVAFTSDGANVPGYPKYTTPGNEVRTTPALGDLDNNLKVDVAVKSEDGMLYVWESPQQSGSIKLAWPMFWKDERHTNSISGGTFGIATSSLPAGTVGMPYSAILEAGYGVQPYTWSITAGVLPDGLVLDIATGEISGIPAVAMPYNFTVQVMDANSDSVSKDFSIEIYEVLTITTFSLPHGTTGTPYSQGLSAAGGAPPFTWAVTNGTLPDGLTLDGLTGVISGTPATVSTSNFTVQVTDVNSTSVTKDLSIAVYGAMTITPSTLPYGRTGIPYSQSLAVSGGMAPYTWSISAGTLPDGLSLDGATGVISGAPATAATSNFTVQVTDANADTVSKDFSIAVYDPLSINPSVLPVAEAGSPYAQNLSVSGGLSPYTWAVISGALPDGLSLSSITGMISGTPTTVGFFEFTVEVLDANGNTLSKDLSISVGTTTTYFIYTSSNCGQATYSRGPEYARFGTVSGDCAIEDTLQWSFKGGSDLLIGYLSNGGYAVDTEVRVKDTGTNLSVLVHGSGAHVYVRLVEVSPADGSIIRTMYTTQRDPVADTLLEITDLGNLWGTVSAGNTLGIQLSAWTPGRMEVEVKWGRTGGGPGLEQWFTVTEAPMGIAPPPGNNPPVANANGPYNGTVDTAVPFTSAGSSDPDGDAITYLWDFGDGNTSTEADPSHIYTAANTYTVTLTVTDSHGAQSQDTTNASITTGGGGNQPPVADAGPDKTAQVRQNIDFDASASYDPDGTIVSYDWDFGDGKTGTGVVTTHKFTKAGTYTVTLTVTDDQGATGNDTATVTVSP